MYNAKTGRHQFTIKELRQYFKQGYKVAFLHYPIVGIIDDAPGISTISMCATRQAFDLAWDTLWAKLNS